MSTSKKIGKIKLCHIHTTEPCAALKNEDIVCIIVGMKATYDLFFT